MSQNKCKKIFQKLTILNKLSYDLKKSIKILYVFEDYEMKSNVILITNDDIVYCFGNNSKGMLGFGHENNILEEFIINEDLSGKMLIDFKNTYSTAIARDVYGKVYVWGSNEGGVVGNGLNDEQYCMPAINKFLDNQNIIDMSCGCGHTIVLTICGKVFSWGRNNRGQVGNGTNVDVLEPYKINLFKGYKVKAIECGFHHSIVLTESGSVYSWGRNDFGQLGLEHWEDFENRPKRIEVEAIIEKISCGAHHTLLLSNEGEIYVFGCNDWGELGVGSAIPGCSNKPIKLYYKNRFVEIQAHNRFHTSASLSENGYIYVWGDCEEKKVYNPLERDYECFDDLFIDYTETTIRAINYFSYIINCFLQNGKYKNNWIEICEIGIGNYGNVMKSKRKIDETVFAVKKVDAIEYKSNESINELIDSGKLLNFNSERLVKYSDIWFENKFKICNGFRNNAENNYILYIQMELCDQNFSQIIKDIKNDDKLYSNGLLTELGYYITSELFLEILEGVNYLHKENIIHGGLKPSNILLKLCNNDGIIKIGDYGLSKVYEIARNHTKDRSDMKFAAPEVVDGGHYDIRADIYSLGRILKQIFHIDVNNNQINESPLLINKYKFAEKLFYEMISERFGNRPHCHQIIDKREEWALNASEFDFMISKQMFEQIIPKPKTNIQRLIMSKLSGII